MAISLLQIALQDFALLAFPFLERIVGDVPLGFAHQVQVEVQVVDAREREPERFPGVVQVAQVRAAEVAAAVAVAIRVHGLVEFFGMARRLVAQHAFAREQHAVARVAGGHHSVAHVHAALDELQQVPRRSYAHHVAGVVLRQNVGAEVCDLVHRLGGLAYGEASHGESVGPEFRDALDSLLAQVLVHAALDNPEELLVVTVDGRVLLEPLHGLGRPLEGVIQAVFRLFRGTREGRALVERHDDVGADFALGVHDACGAKEVF